MSLLRVFRNLAVLVILTVGVLSMSPRPTTAQSSCRPLGSVCGRYLSCCPGSLCGPIGRCCNKPLYGMACTRADVCCRGFCYIRPGQTVGECW